ncbi:MAG: glycosyl hydrolase family 79 C-terminal domain-containing protein [Bacteroidota bacterium]|nr:glycosyl hydrolase family 79 C-terminal domain-containing protein [Bacteroidota bacterium]
MRKIYILILLALVLVSCHKEHPGTKDNTNLLINNDHTVNVTFAAAAGDLVPTTYEGLSFENSILAEDESFLNANNKVVVQLMKNLGPGILRMGGASSDLTTWSRSMRNPGTPLDVITTTDIDRLAAFSRAIDWPVLFGLNLGNNDPALAADEAAYVNQSIGTNLYAFQFGNEPDAYAPYTHHRNPSYGFNDFLAEWRGYHAAVKKAVPGAEFAGPDIAFNSSWITSFHENEGSETKLQDGHYYEAGPATDMGIDYNTILGRSYKFGQLLDGVQAASKVQPYRVTEINNVYGGGKPGVSDVFASALWALDIMWAFADQSCQGINFHTGKGLFYSPIMNENGVFVTKPEYYAMLAFKYGSANGRLVATTTDNTFVCSAHTTVINNTYSITLINKDVNKSYDFNIIPNKSVLSAKVYRLSAPSITAKEGITFAGSKVNADGTFNPSASENVTITKRNFIVNVPAGSAAVVVAQ